jgi:hypothetical protein
MHFSTNQLLLEGGFEDLVSKEAAREGNLTCSKVRHAFQSPVQSIQNFSGTIHAYIPLSSFFSIHTPSCTSFQIYYTNWTHLSNSLLEVRQQFDSKLPIMWSQLGKMTLYFLGIYAAAQLGARGVVTPIG